MVGTALDKLAAPRRVAAGRAGPGSIVRVKDRAGRIKEYELVPAPDAAPRRVKLALGSSAGQALLGARPGDRLRLTLPNGRRERVRVLGVRPGR